MEGYKRTSNLPPRLNRKVIMILDGVPQKCREITLLGEKRRWFYGDENGAFPEDEVEYWKEVDA